MFYVTRHADGSIQSVSKLQEPGSEPMDMHHPELQGFFQTQGAAPAFVAVDADFVRVIEDLIDTLIMKNVIRHTDLPAAAQKKLILRKGLRNRVQGALNLWGGDDQVL